MSKTPPRFQPGLPYLGSTLLFGNDPIAFAVEGYRRHGPVHRARVYTTDYVVFGGLEANKFIWENDPMWNFEVTGAIFRENFDDTYLPQLMGAAHRRKRRRLQPAFKPGTLMKFVPDMASAAQAQLAEVENTPADLRQLCNCLIVAMTSQALLGVTLPPRLDETIVQVEHHLLQGRLLGPWRQWWYHRPRYLERKGRMLGFIDRALSTKAAAPIPAEDLLTLMSQPGPGGEAPPSRQEMIYDATMVFLAGSNTTAHLVLWALLYLFRRPDWLSSLREELKDWNPASFSGMGDYPRLKATIMEIERLRPPFPFFSRSALQPFSYAGFDFPTGQPILHPIALPHFLEEVYENPLEFRPERFLQPGMPPARAHGTFGGGAHVCLGQPLARIQSPLLLAEVITRYDMKMNPDLSLQARFDGLLTPVEKRLLAILRRR